MGQYGHSRHLSGMKARNININFAIYIVQQCALKTVSCNTRDAVEKENIETLL